MRTKPEDFIGLKFGEWELISYVGVGDCYNKRYNAKCSCGRIKIVYLAMVKNGKSKSCGCKIIRNKKHGMTKSRLYGIWGGIKDRCLNPNFRQYKDYGGRGIEIYPYWKDDFQMFLYWCIRGGGYKEGLELDRIDNNKGYNPMNCRFTTHTINNRNKRNNRRIMFNGEERLLIELCETRNLNYKTIDNRIKTKVSNK